MNEHQTFPRSDGPLVSVIFPSRGRSSWLRQAIDSLYSLSVNKDQIEYILKVDDDDDETIATVEKLAEEIDLRAIVSPRGNGYADIHEWYNEMSKMARGDWILIFNDDCRMVTADWDHVLLHCTVDKLWHSVPDVMMTIVPSVGRPDTKEFFFVRRKVVEILGMMSPIAHMDNWLTSVMEFVKSLRVVPIMVDHFSDRIGDKVREESDAASQATGPDLMGRTAVLSRFDAAAKLLAYINDQENGKAMTEPRTSLNPRIVVRRPGSVPGTAEG